MKRFLQWLEINNAILRKPTKYRHMTTYYLHCEWVGRLTGTLYHLNSKFDVVEGELNEHRQR